MPRSFRISRPDRWVLARKIIQALALIGFLAAFFLAWRASFNPEAVSIPLRLDPLAMLAQMLASRTFLTGSALSLVLLILGLAAGRAWCGWLCPLGTLLDIFSPDGKYHFPKVPPESLRRVKYILLLLILMAALLGNLTLLVLDPLVLLYRTLAVGILPAVERIVSAVEAFVYPLPYMDEPVSRFDAFVRPYLLPPLPVYYRGAFLYVLAFAALAALNWAAARFWCRYLCPLGGLLGLLGKVSFFRRRVDKGCTACGACSRACPTGTIDPALDYASDPSECTLCMECFQSCPRSVLSLSAGIGAAPWRSYDPRRRDFLATAGGTVLMTGLFAADRYAFRPSDHLIRPPGASNDDILSKCMRCGACMRACPSGAIQPALDEAGLEGLWTPILITRLGFCDYSCNACGQVCPVQAIPPLPLEEKRLQVIGNATINRDRCLAWSDHVPCIVCQEVCAGSDTAVVREPQHFTAPDGSAASLDAPVVQRERCIGCGICEYKCPVNGEAAIRVYVANLS